MRNLVVVLNYVKRYDSFVKTFHRGIRVITQLYRTTGRPIIFTRHTQKAPFGSERNDFIWVGIAQMFIHVPIYACALHMACQHCFGRFVFFIVLMRVMSH